MSKKNNTSTPKLKTLPPTKEAFMQSVKSAHFQNYIWIHAELNMSDPPNFGWFMENSQLQPIAISNDLPPDPDILELISCKCGSCTSMNCSCLKGQVSCTMYCKCRGEAACHNIHTKFASDSDESDEQECLNE